MAGIDWDWIIRQLPYEGRKQTARTQYQGAIAQTAYNRAMLAAKEGMDTARMTSQWHDARQQLPGQFGRRGLLNSGIYKKGLGDFATDRQSAFDELRFGYEKQRGQFSLDDQTAESNLQSGLTQIEYERVAADQARRADLASQLRGVL